MRGYSVLFLIKASNTLKTSRFTGVNTKAGAVKGAIVRKHYMKSWFPVMGQKMCLDKLDLGLKEVREGQL